MRERHTQRKSEEERARARERVSEISITLYERTIKKEEYNLFGTTFFRSVFGVTPHQRAIFNNNDRNRQEKERDSVNADYYGYFVDVVGLDDM